MGYVVHYVVVGRLVVHDVVVGRFVVHYVVVGRFVVMMWLLAHSFVVSVVHD